MPSAPFTLTKEKLIEWLNDKQYMEKYAGEVYHQMLVFYFDTFFAQIYPAPRAIIEIEKDLGVKIDHKQLLTLFYYSYWARKKKKEQSGQKAIEGKREARNLQPNTQNQVTDSQQDNIDSQPSIIPAGQTNQSEQSKPGFEFRDAKDISPQKPKLYLSKEERRKLREEEEAKQNNTK